MIPRVTLRGLARHDMYHIQRVVGKRHADQNGGLAFRYVKPSFYLGIFQARSAVGSANHCTAFVRSGQ